MTAVLSRCSTRFPAPNRDPSCPVCDALVEAMDPEDDAANERAVNLIFDRIERVQAAHRQYGRKQRRRR